MSSETNKMRAQDAWIAKYGPPPGEPGSRVPLPPEEPPEPAPVARPPEMTSIEVIDRLQRQHFKHLREMNLVSGTATNLLTALGLSWEGEVAILCNFAGDFEETKARWEAAARKAHKRILAAQRVREALVNLHALHINEAHTGPGQPQWEAMKAIAETEP